MRTTPSACRWAATLLLTVGGVVACEDPARPPSLPATVWSDETFSVADLPASREALARPAPESDASSPTSVQVRDFALVSGAPIEIEGAPSEATIVLNSSASRPLGAYYWFLDIDQGSSWVEAAWGWTDCGAGTGVVPPGRCALRRQPFTATHSGRHSGTLVPGPATLRFVLYWARDGRARQVTAASIPVLLTAPSVSGVVVTPSHYEFGAPGGVFQLSASVLPPSAPQGVLWSSSNAAVAAVSSTGQVTAVGPGGALVVAQAAANAGARGTSLISVGTAPVFGTGVNASPGAWDAVPGMQLRFAAQVVNGPQQVTWSSSNAALVTISAVAGQATAVGSPGNATLTARSVADNTQSADVNVRIFSLSWRAPASATFVSTGAVSPPANPLSVTLQVQACQSPTVTSLPFQAARYEVLSGGAWVNIGQSTSFFVLDIGGITRCWVYPMTWTPGTAFGTGPQTLRATMIDHFGGLGSYAANNFVTITTP